MHSPPVNSQVKDLIDWVLQTSRPHASGQLDGLAEVIWSTHSELESRQRHRSTSDWPFENFWGNPHEPSHSKFLGHFLDPGAGHQCGEYLLGEFLQVLQDNDPLLKDSNFSAKNCRVIAEKGYIDLLIICHHAGGGCSAIIMENKVKGARDRPFQLNGYVKKVKAAFDPGAVHALYMPLTPERPLPADAGALKDSGVNVRTLAFDPHILQWLDRVLSPESRVLWPPRMTEGIEEHLQLYRSLIKHMIEKGKELAMDRQTIRQHLESLTETPKESDVSLLQTSVDTVHRCLKALLRGKFLIAVGQALQREAAAPVFVPDSGEASRITPSPASASDAKFDHHTCVGVSVNGEALACVGAGEEGTHFWIGYRKECSTNEPVPHANTALEAFKETVGPEVKSNANWQAWNWLKDATYDNCTDPAKAHEVAELLLKLQKSLQAKLAATPGLPTTHAVEQTTADPALS